MKTRNNNLFLINQKGIFINPKTFKAELKYAIRRQMTGEPTRRRK